MTDAVEANRLVVALTEELAASGVRYCHWKSNEAIERSLSADNDLDLLVDRRHFGAFLGVMGRLGFRPASAPTIKQVPGMVSFYGIDEETRRVVHVDGHFQLVLGDDTTKNYRLPIEEAYLSTLDLSGSVPVPHPEIEYLVFVIRMVLKHCPWDAQLSYKARLTASEERELRYLEDRIDPDILDGLRGAHVPAVAAPLFERCRKALGRELNPLARAAVARQLTVALRGFDRVPPARDTTRRIARRAVGFVQRRRQPGYGRKHLTAGGVVVAVVGGDGSGKTSMVEYLEELLSRHVLTKRFHLGKPIPSALTRAVRAVIRRVAPRRSLERTRLPTWEVETHEGYPGLVFQMWHLLTARDRYRTHLSARRAAARGAVVICDRYPIGLATMDGPRSDRAPGIDGGRVAEAIRSLERTYYNKMSAPDITIVMKVDPAVAASRRQDQDSEFVRRRAREIYERAWVGPGVLVVDADRPLDEVRRDVGAILWSAL